MGITINGIAQAKRQLAEVIGETASVKANRAMFRILHIVAPLAAKYTPIDTSTLINSQYSEVMVNGAILTGRIGYSANYAIYVHDPNVKQIFRKPGAKKEFLSSAFKESESAFEGIIKEEMGL
ncbi:MULTISPECIES: hypothetical protein [Haemophilus]|uniref:hypothetical protein n=1 Tax=Haemophilus TaxID=724 RepID=UPI00066E31A0|nr:MULTISPECIES: hypothetical protein [Haemophilus]DAV09200.1 MAG TPA: Minor capsid protein [Caudoviricetes sp.]